MSLSGVKEDYILAIYRLEGKGSLTLTALAKYMGLAKSTVSERVKELHQAKYIDAQPYKKITLTTKGKKSAEKLLFKHRVIEHFLHSTLQISKSKVHEEAHKLEHAFSDETIKKLYSYIGKPEKGAHNEEIKPYFKV
jgi:DtxR family Mn-dependent transcriptional regulator